MEKSIRVDDGIGSEILPHINSLRKGNNAKGGDNARALERTNAAKDAWQKKEDYISYLRKSGKADEADYVDRLSDFIANLL